MYDAITKNVALHGIGLLGSRALLAVHNSTKHRTKEASAMVLEIAKYSP